MLKFKKIKLVKTNHSRNIIDLIKKSILFIF